MTYMQSFAKIFLVASEVTLMSQIENIISTTIVFT